MADRRQAPAVRRNRGTTQRNVRNTKEMYGSSYVQGTAAPKLKPHSHPEEERHQRPQRKGTAASSVRISHRIRRNQERAMYVDLPYVVLLTIASMFTLYLCVSYLQVQSSITARMHNIERLESRLEKLKAENDALETNINTSVDLNKIYEIATKELGMVYAKKDQVLLYDKTESEYVRQYEDIPEH